MTPPSRGGVFIHVMYGSGSREFKGKERLLLFLKISSRPPNKNIKKLRGDNIAKTNYRPR